MAAGRRPARLHEAQRRLRLHAAFHRPDGRPLLPGSEHRLGRRRVRFLRLAIDGGTVMTSLRPGEIWPDASGVHINAHGGGVLFHDGVYYWFGEHKTAGEAGNRANVGVGVYTSRDLLHWTNA